jgi:hypothetical protein
MCWAAPNDRASSSVVRHYPLRQRETDPLAGRQPKRVPIHNEADEHEQDRHCRYPSGDV